MIASQALAGIKFEPLSPGMSGPPSMPNAVYPPVHAANGVNPMNPLAQQQGMNPLLAHGFPPMPVPLASAGLPPSHPHHLPFAFGGAGPQAFAPYGAAANPFAPGHPNPNVVLRPSSAAPGGTGAAAAAAGGLAGAFKQAKKKPATANGKKENDKESKTKETRTKKSKDKSTKEESDDIYDDMPGLTSLVSSSHDPATANEKEKVSASQSQQEGKSEGSKSSAPSSSSSTVTVDTRKKEKSSDADKKTPVPKAKEDKADCKQS